jgi:hypothetical protein
MPSGVSFIWSICYIVSCKAFTWVRGGFFFASGMIWLDLVEDITLLCTKAGLTTTAGDKAADEGRCMGTYLARCFRVDLAICMLIIENLLGNIFD